MKKYVNFKIIAVFTVILFFSLIYFFITNFNFFEMNTVEAVYADNISSEVIKNVNPLNIDEILKTNSGSNIKEEMTYEEIDLEYTTQYINNDELPTGTMHVTQVGIDGKQEVITIKKYNNDELISEQIVGNSIIKASINKTVEIGTGRGRNNYKLKKGDIVYSTPSSLPVYMEENLGSEKIISIAKGTEVKTIEVFKNGWSYIFADGRYGYVLSETLSNINPLKIDEIEISKDEYSKQELLGKLSKDMDVGTPSGLSLEQFRKVLQNNPKDVNGIFSSNSDYFYYAEQSYGVNGLFLAAVAIHESGWGTSSIAKNKNNLFGYMAYDSNPYSSSANFASVSEGIDLLARVFMKYYLKPNGTKIYGGNVAEGKYYSGSTVFAVNKHYATDSNWGNSVYNIMKKLYESI